MMGGIDGFELRRIMLAAALVVPTIALAQPSPELEQAYAICAANKVTPGADGSDPKSFQEGYQSCTQIVDQMLKAKEAQAKNRPANLQQQERANFEALQKKLGVK